MKCTQCGANSAKDQDATFVQWGAGTPHYCDYCGGTAALSPKEQKEERLRIKRVARMRRKRPS